MLPEVSSWAEPVWHLFVVRNKERDQLQHLLNQAGVGTLIHYPIPPHMQQAFAYLGHGEGAFPIAEGIDAEALSLPMFPSMTPEQMDRVITACCEAAGSMQ